MQNKTIILIDAIVMIGASIFLVVFNVTAGFTFAEIFSSSLDMIDLVGPLVLVPFAISVLFANFGYASSAKIVMLVGFAILAFVLIALTAFYATEYRYPDS
ncbi:MAG: hypothetical protein ACRD5H_03150 [Nitrososphaerales archaeon]